MWFWWILITTTTQTNNSMSENNTQQRSIQVVGMDMGLVHDLVEYLSQRPYRETAGLINRIDNAMPMTVTTDDVPATKNGQPPKAKKKETSS